MKILFLHGWQSTPGGRKPTYLKDHGHTVLNPALPDDDFLAAVRIAQAEFDQHQPDVIVGSSRGGAVAMNIDSGQTPLVLLCPAWKRWGTATTVKPNTIILHSEQDDVIPFSDSQELLRNSRLSESVLVVVGTEHRLADPESLAAMLEAVAENGVKVETLVGGVVPHEVGVPNRFGVGTLLTISTMYAVLFALWRLLGGSLRFLVWVTLFFSAIGLGQMLLYKGRQPRKASVVVGAYVYPFMFIGFIIQKAIDDGQYITNEDLSDVGLIVIFFVYLFLFSIPVGMILGYLAGLLIAAHFFVIDKWRNRRARTKDVDPAEGAGTN